MQAQEGLAQRSRDVEQSLFIHVQSLSADLKIWSTTNIRPLHWRLGCVIQRCHQAESIPVGPGGSATPGIV